MRRHVAVLAAIVCSLAVAAPAPASTRTNATVQVGLDRHAYSDGTHRASFVVEGGCVAQSPRINLSSATCEAGNAHAQGSLRSAVLGFDAVHTVEAVPADLPRIQTEGRLLSEQLSVVRVDVQEEATLRVRVTAPPLDGVTARPIASASMPAATESGADWVAWEAVVPKGSHTFSTRFEFSGETVVGATYLPKVAVTREVDASQPLLSIDGGSGDIGATRRSATVVMKARATKTTVAPTFGDGSFYGAVNQYGLTQSFGGQMAFDAPTDYQAARHGEVSARFDTMLARLAPGSGDALNGAMRSIAAATESKVDFAFGEGWVGLRTARAVRTFPALTVDPFAGMIYAGDSVHVGVAIAALSAHTDKEGEPTNTDGALAVDWDGSTATAWSTTFANRAPAGEPNSWNHADLLRTGPLRQMSPPAGQLLQTAYAVPLIASGGDIDNRHGDAPMVGPATTFSAPANHTVAGIVTSRTAPSEANATFTNTVNSGDSGVGLDSVTVTPAVGPGGYWLQSTRDGYKRDWAGGYRAVVVSRPSAAGPIDNFAWEQVVTVPRGFTTELDFVTPHGDDDQVRLRVPGTYRVRVNNGRISAVLIDGTGK